MGKASKRKVADFHKPKLKVGKRKPVGTNVTDTAFKTGSINIATQLEESTDPKNKRNLSLKDLLSQLNHYNVTIRHEALVGIKDLFVCHPETMHKQINIWLFKVLDKISDVDPTVRRSLQLCLKHLCNELEINEITPFVNVIVAHLRSGMTHINEGVQMDALAILELILDKYSRLFILYSGKLLESLSNLICKQGRRETASSQISNLSKVHKGIPKLVNRDVSIDIESKMSSLTVRAKVLGKLLGVLKVLLVDTATKNKKIFNKTETARTTYVTSDHEVHVRIFPSPINENEMSFNEWLDIADESNVRNRESRIMNFIQDIYPVLLHSWVEYEPGQLSSGLRDTSSSNSSLQGMANIIGILDLFISLDGQKQQEHFFLVNDSNMFKEFSVHFLNYFSLPLSYTRIHQRKSISKQDNSDALHKFAISFNFVMAKYIHRLLMHNGEGSILLDNKAKSRYIKQLGTFFIDVLDSKISHDKNQIEEFLQIFVEIIMNLYDKTLLDQSDWELLQCNSVLSKMVACFDKASVTSPWKISLINLFYRISFERKEFVKERGFEEQVQKFIKNVIRDVWSYPSTSMELVGQSLHFIKKILVCQLHCSGVQTTLEKTMNQITDPSQGSYQHYPYDVLKIVFEIIYYMTSLPLQLTHNIVLICHKQNVNISLMKYLLSILSLCLQKSTPSISIEEFTKLILSVILNYSTSELKLRNCDKESNISWCSLNLYYDEKKNLLADHAIKQLELLTGSEQLWDKLLYPIGNLVTMFRHIPVSTSIGLTKLLSKLSDWSRQKNNEDVEHTVSARINQVAEIASAVLLFTLSQTYKTTIDIKDGGQHVNCEMKDEPLGSVITLLSDNHVILQQLLKKWSNIVNEYYMDSACVTSIMQVLIVLLQEPNLNEKLLKLKPELTLITNIPMDVSARNEDVSTVQRLRNILTQMGI